MNKFMETDFAVTDIITCCIVKFGTPIHKNRASHGLAFYPNGGSEFFFNGKKISAARPNSLIYLPQTSNYTVCSDNNAEKFCYVINFLSTENILCNNLEPFSVTVKDIVRFTTAFAMAEKAFRTQKPGYIMQCKAYLCEIISALQYEHSLGYIDGKAQNRISLAINKIHETYTKTSPSVSTLAAMCGISPEYFRITFKKACGKSPSRYIYDLRINRAKELLSSGMYSVSESALLSGFTDVCYFSRSFKKAVGISPTDFIKNAKN